MFVKPCTLCYSPSIFVMVHISRIIQPVTWSGANNVPLSLVRSEQYTATIWGEPLRSLALINVHRSPLKFILLLFHLSKSWRVVSGGRYHFICSNPLGVSPCRNIYGFMNCWSEAGKGTESARAKAPIPHTPLAPPFLSSGSLFSLFTPFVYSETHR